MEEDPLKKMVDKAYSTALCLKGKSKKKIIGGHFEAHFPKLKGTLSNKEAYKTFLKYIEDVKEVPFIRSFDLTKDKYSTFEGRLFKLFKDNNLKESVFENKVESEQSKIYDPEQASIVESTMDSMSGDNDSYFLLSQEAFGIVENSLKTYKGEDFQKAVFVVKLAETIGYANVMNISGGFKYKLTSNDEINEAEKSCLKDITDMSVGNKINEKNLVDIYTLIEQQILKKAANKNGDVGIDIEVIQDFYKSMHKDSLFDSKNLRILVLYSLDKNNQLSDFDISKHYLNELYKFKNRKR